MTLKEVIALARKENVHRLKVKFNGKGGLVDVEMECLPPQVLEAAAQAAAQPAPAVATPVLTEREIAFKNAKAQAELMYGHTGARLPDSEIWAQMGMTQASAREVADAQ